jgi:HPt (histidine-containing phosphotransfer) domain-containing protein
MTAGRPNKPIELKKKHGTYRPGRTPANVTPISLERAETTPEPLRPLGEAGQAFWLSIWKEGINWISPQTDIFLVQVTAEQFDEREQLKEIISNDPQPRNRSGLRELDKQITGNLAALGLNPAERSRLGFALVKTESKLEELMRRKRENEERREQARTHSSNPESLII